MKKVNLILVIITLALIVSIGGMYFARNKILVYVFEKLVNNESSDKITLQIKGLIFDVARKDVYIDSLMLNFKTGASDTVGGMRLQKMVLSEVWLRNLKINRLLEDGVFDADSLVVHKPILRFITVEGKSKIISDPQKIFKILEKSSGNNYGILVKLGVFEVKYGNVKVRDPVSNKVNFSTGDLTFIMKDFNTTVNDSVYVYGRMFFANSLFIGIKNLYKYVKPGYDLYVDSLMWRSADYKLFVKGVNFKPAPSLHDSITSIKFSVKDLFINDFHLLSDDSLSSVKISSVKLNNGILDIYEQNSKKKTGGNKREKNIYNFFKVLKIDTLTFDNIRMYLRDYKNDTILYFNKLKAYIDNIYLDSLFLKKPGKHFNYGKFNLKAFSFSSKHLFPGYEIHNSEVYYDNLSKNINLKGFSLIKKGGGLATLIKKATVNLSLKKLIRKKHQKIDLFVVSPRVNLDFTKLDYETGHDEDLIKLLKPGLIKIEKGNVNIITRTGDTVSINDLKLLTDNFSFNDSVLNYDTLNINISGFKFEKPGSYNVSFTRAVFDDYTFECNNLKILNGKGVLRKLNSDNIIIDSLDLKTFVSGKRFVAKNFVINNIKEVLALINNKKVEDTTSYKLYFPEIVKSVEKESSVSFDIKNIEVRNNIFVTDTLYNNRLKVYFAGNLRWRNFKYGNKNDKPLSNISGFKVNIYHGFIENDGYLFKIDSIYLNSDKGLIDIKRINLTQADDTSKNWVIKKFNVNDFHSDNFDFRKLFNHNIVSFNSIEYGNVDISTNRVFPGSVIDEKIKPFDLSFVKNLRFKLIFDTVKGINTNIQITDTTSRNFRYFNLSNLSFIFIPRLKENNMDFTSGTLFSDMDFYADSLNFIDKKTNTSVNLQDVAFRGGQHKLTFYSPELQFGNRKNGGINSTLKKVIFYDIYSSDTLPLKIGIGHMDLSGVKMEVYGKNVKDSIKNTNDINKKKFSGLYRFSSLVNSLNIDSVSFSKMNLSILTGAKKKITVDDLYLNLIQLSIFPYKALDTVPFKLKNFNAVIYNREFVTGDSLYRFKANKLNYTSYNNTLEVDSFYVIPQYDTLEFFKHHKWQTDRVKMFVKKLEFSGFDFDKFRTDNYLHLKFVNIDRLAADIYRDKNFPRDTTKIKPLVQDLLRKVKTPFRIDSISVNNSYFRYSELGVKSFKPGYVYFTNCNLHAGNITNIPEPGAGETLNVSLNMHLMGDGNITGKFYFPLESKNSEFYYNASSEKLDLTSLNPMTENLLGLTIASGKGKLEIPLITADDTLAKGFLLFKYRMKIKLYNRKKAEKNKDKDVSSPLFNFIINSFVLKNRNPNIFNKPRIGIVYFKRDRTKAIPNYVWKSTLSGILYTMGFNSKDQRKEKKEFKKNDFYNYKEAIERERRKKKHKKSKATK